MIPQAGPAHPRDANVLIGLDTQAEAFGEAVTRGRLHHAWLLCGPEGSGKASFAYQAARRLLGGAPDHANGSLATRDADPVARMIAAQSHPDLLVLERGAGEGGAAARKSIPVEEARRVPEFFSKTPAIAPYRVAIIDAADDLNVNAANAVLKTLEEPSGRGVLFLVAHAPGRLLATVRSRCRRLSFAPWSEPDLAAFLAERLALEPPACERLAQLAGGAPGRALSLAAQGALELDERAAAILAAMPETDAAALQAIADGFRGGEGARRFALVLDRLADRVRTTALRLTAGDSEAADRWSGAWRRLTELPSLVEGLNLDRTDAFWSVMAELRSIARTHPPVHATRA